MWRMSLLVVIVALIAGCGRREATIDAPPPRTPQERPELTIAAGGAQLQVIGAVSGTLMFDQIAASPQSVYDPAEPVTALYWTNDDQQEFQYGGRAMVGTHKTGDDNTEIMLLLGDSIFRSLAGECVVTIVRADDDGIAGEFSCVELGDDQGNRLDRVDGTFEALREAAGWNTVPAGSIEI